MAEAIRGVEGYPLIVPEVGINHAGSVETAICMARAARDAGASIIKFQTHIIESEMVPNDLRPGSISRESVWNIVSRCSLSEAEEAEVARECRLMGLEFLSTPFSIAAVARLINLDVGAIKVGSGEVSNHFLLREIAQTNLPVVLSTGMHTLDEVEMAVEILSAGETSAVALLHCVSVYPTPHAQMNLMRIRQIMRRFPGVPVGLSDHSTGIWAALASVALGSTIIEKHFTYDLDLEGPDIPVSIGPDDLKDLVEGSRAIWETLNESSVTHEPDEDAIKRFALSSIVAARDLAAGQVLKQSDLSAKRPALGDFRGCDSSRVVGRRLLTRTRAGEYILEENLIS